MILQLMQHRNSNTAVEINAARHKGFGAFAQSPQYLVIVLDIR